MGDFFETLKRVTGALNAPLFHSGGAAISVMTLIVLAVAVVALFWLSGRALGVGIGFGLHQVTSNFVSGLVLLVERPIKVGDRIEVDGLSGDAVRIAPRATTIATNDNIAMIVPGPIPNT